MHSSHHGDHVWALVLAGGDGNRLKSLTTTADGVAIPKQYCSLHGSQTLLEGALIRAETVAVKQRVCTVVATQHRAWWQGLLGGYPVDHIVEQPKNCGTAIGIMLPLLHILRHDPQAQIVMLPSDHHVHDEATLSDALQRASDRLNEHTADKLIILGVEPEHPDTELGYVLPGKYLRDGLATVASFAEKPPLLRTHQLLAQGALWNTFIVAAKGSTLLQLFKQRCAGLLEEMQAIVHGEHEVKLGRLLLDELYARLPTLDFSRDILQGIESYLEVLSVSACGWSDLGTPRRIREVLHRWPQPQSVVPQSAQSATQPTAQSAAFVLADHAGFLLNKSMHDSAYARTA
jgi:mannose-1-phosphate guanylyltransferase